MQHVQYLKCNQASLWAILILHFICPKLMKLESKNHEESRCFLWRLVQWVFLLHQTYTSSQTHGFKEKYSDEKQKYLGGKMLRKWRYAFYLARTFFMLISYHFSSKSTEGESGLRVEEKRMEGIPSEWLQTSPLTLAYPCELEQVTFPSLSLMLTSDAASYTAAMSIITTCLHTNIFCVRLDNLKGRTVSSFCNLQHPAKNLVYYMLSITACWINDQTREWTLWNMKKYIARLY